ncbi:hypothetical protein SDC9_109704 [bioreactor metagenome]|uniref:Uncharacterized protein n=1 Tax=bioreactor metagenome TaxID=1076179 RepID=A0A645BCK5_9ZZZZ
MALDSTTQTGTARLAVLEHLHGDGCQIERAWIRMLFADHEHATAGVVGHGVLDANFPVVDA